METKKEIAEKITKEIENVILKRKEIAVRYYTTNDSIERISLGVEYDILQGKYEGLITAYDILIGYHR
jgi:hypothetical protein